MFVRVSSLKERFMPTSILYEVSISGEVTRMVEVDPNGDIFWDSVDSCQHPSEMIGINSLVEGPFKKKQDWPQSNTCIYEEMTADAFELWFEKAQMLGDRRTHAEMIAAVDNRRKPTPDMV